MKQGIHPEYIQTNVTCSCGNTFVTRSVKSELHVELCDQCHPFYTGKQKLVDTGGRVERFQKKYAKRARAAGAVEKEEAAAAAEAKASAPAEPSPVAEAKASAPAEPSPVAEAKTAPPDEPSPVAEAAPGVSPATSEADAVPEPATAAVSAEAGADEDTSAPTTGAE